MQKGRAMMFKPCLLLGLACSMAAWVHAAEPAQLQAQASPELQWLRSLRPALERPSTAAAQPASSQAAAGGPAAGPAPATAVISVPPTATTTATTATTAPVFRPGSPAEVQEWAILLSDKTLYRTLRRWAQEARLQLLWQVDRDYPIEAEVVFNSTLREAVGQVMVGVALTDYPLQAVFNSSTRVLRVIRHLDDQRR